MISRAAFGVKQGVHIQGRGWALPRGRHSPLGWSVEGQFPGAGLDVESGWSYVILRPPIVLHSRVTLTHNGARECGSRAGPPGAAVFHGCFLHSGDLGALPLRISPLIPKFLSQFWDLYNAGAGGGPAVRSRAAGAGSREHQQTGTTSFTFTIRRGGLQARLGSGGTDCRRCVRGSGPQSHLDAGLSLFYF